MKTENNPKAMKILNEYAGGHRHLITVGRILAAVSAFMGLVPFYDLWKIIRIAVNGEGLSKIVGIAWQAVGIDGGKIVQQGKHNELMQQDGIYRIFVTDRQKSGKLEALIKKNSGAVANPFSTAV